MICIWGYKFKENIRILFVCKYLIYIHLNILIINDLYYYNKTNFITQGSIFTIIKSITEKMY